MNMIFHLIVHMLIYYVDVFIDKKKTTSYFIHSSLLWRRNKGYKFCVAKIYSFFLSIWKLFSFFIEKHLYILGQKQRIRLIKLNNFVLSIASMSREC